MPRNEHGSLDFPTNPVSNDVFVDSLDTQWRFNGTDWAIFEPYRIDDLPDVTITDAQVGQVLEWNGTYWENTDEGLDLSSLEDVVLTDPQDGDFLVNDGTNWINTTIPPKVFFYGENEQLNFPAGHFNNNPFLVIYDLNIIDPNNMYDNLLGKVTIPEDGLYHISWGRSCSNTYGTINPESGLCKYYNSSDTELETVILANPSQNNSGTYNKNVQTMFRYLNAGDYIRIWEVKNNRFDNVDPSGSVSFLHLAVEQL